MDALSDVLHSVRLTGAVFFDIHAAEPWVAATPPGRSIVSRIFPGTEHLIPYHVVMEGSCWVGIGGEAPIRLSGGDIIMFPHGHAHVLSSAPGARSKPDLALYRRPSDRQLPFEISMGDVQNVQAHVVCGYLGCDARPFNPLLAALPNVVRLSGQGSGALAAYVRAALAEAKAPRLGGESVLGRLSELMFVDVVRRYLEELPAERRDWLAGLRDPAVGRALNALHRMPSRSWTLAALAREVGVSRSVLAERFTQFVGRPPMQYLTNWRLQRAAHDLRSGSDSIAVIADRVGYESATAFSRAFKKALGVPPSAWRQR
ncbi:MAG TPA: AraC family transcriptional regulator [Steroidobacteraceae bacterium]|nr:AraC family transcriptional regulator [Steroidobacteraceae bacterium]